MKPILIDGQDVTQALRLNRLDPGARLLRAGIAVLVGLWLLVAVPLALLTGLGAVLGLVVLGSVGLPLLAAALAAGLMQAQARPPSPPGLATIPP